MKNKKAQVTVFIILGIVLLFSTALVFYIQEQVTEYKPDVGLVEEAPLEIQPIQMFITDCLERTAIEGLERAGVQGGYIDTTDLKIGLTPTESDAVEFSPGGLKVPYWYYMEADNGCTGACEFGSNILPLKGEVGRTVETELSGYVEDRLNACIAGFSTFKDQGFEVTIGEPDVKTVIGANDVHFQMDYPITVTKGTFVAPLSKFYTKVPLNFGRIYKIAEEITNKEISTNFLENVMINMIEIYSGVDKDKLPPTGDTIFSLTSNTFWMKSDVQAMIKELLIMYVPALQTTNTLNFVGNLYQGTSNLAHAIYNNFILPLDGEYELETSFIYLGWPIYFDITPSAGEIIRSNSASTSLLSFIGINQYKFVYDVSYPVVIELYDPEALNGRGFVFQFALESNLRNNDVINSTTQLYSRSFTGGTQVCQPEMFNSGNITIDVADSFTNQPLEDVAILFSFGQEACTIGSTDKDGQLVSKFPIGIGTLTGVKEDYVMHAQRYGTSLEKEDSVSIKMHQMVEKQITIKKLRVTKQQIGFIEAYRPERNPVALGLNDVVLMTLTKVKENPAEENFAAVVNFLGNESFKTMMLAPGKYEISATLLTYERTVIPSDEICVDTKPFVPFCCDECATIDAMPFDDVFPHGGLDFDEEGEYFEITPADLYGSQYIEFYIISAPDGYTRNANGITNLKHTDLEEAGKVDEYSHNWRGLLEPVFVS